MNGARLKASEALKASAAASAIFSSVVSAFRTIVFSPPPLAGEGVGVDVGVDEGELETISVTEPLVTAGEGVMVGVDVGDGVAPWGRPERVKRWSQPKRRLPKAERPTVAGSFLAIFHRLLDNVMEFPFRFFPALCDQIRGCAD